MVSKEEEDMIRKEVQKRIRRGGIIHPPVWLAGEWDESMKAYRVPIDPAGGRRTVDEVDRAIGVARDEGKDAIGLTDGRVITAPLPGKSGMIEVPLAVITAFMNMLGLDSVNLDRHDINAAYQRAVRSTFVMTVQQDPYKVTLELREQ